MKCDRSYSPWSQPVLFGKKLIWINFLTSLPINVVLILNLSMWCGFIMKYFSLISLFSFALVLGACGGGSGSPSGGNVTATEVEVGKLIFEDTRLSANEDQSCASCHSAANGFADPDVTQTTPVSQGSTGGFGNRNAPTSAYAKFSPSFALRNDSVRNADIYSGGQFIDGRRDTLEAQAKDPFLNLVEMATDAQAVVDKVQNGPYADKFKAVYGDTVFDNTVAAYNRIAKAIAAFERSDEMNPFSSKFDCYLQDSTSFPLSTQEKAGLDLFGGATAKCSSCHTLTPDVSGKVLFTSFQYFNIGVPKNPNNPAGASFTDLGLGGRLADEGVVSVAEAAAEDGKFKTPTLRNIALTAPYMHNGVLATLEDVIRHYDIMAPNIPNDFITPEVNRNIASEIGVGTSGLGLSTSAPDDYAALEAFMNTLTDGTGSCF